jgi:homoserine O-acetyltransferase
MSEQSPHLASRISHLVPWELTGSPRAPIIAVLGGISAGCHVTANAADPSTGWWQELVGPGRAIDTDGLRVLGIDWEVPSSGQITTHDQATALARVLDHLHLGHVSAIVGASYGGMVALAFAERFPRRVGRLAVLCAAHQPHPMATAHRLIQRRIIRLGLAAGTPGDGVALARALGITTYRTAEEFTARFAGPAEERDGVLRFPVERYLDHGGSRYAARCAPERYLALSESIDLHRVEPERITTPTALLAVHGDAIAPVWQVRELRERVGAPCALEEISSIFGHDAFLKEVEAVGAFVSRALAPEVPCAA